MGVIRVSDEVYLELKKLKRKIGVRSMSELILLLIKSSYKELDKFKGDPKIFLKTLKMAGNGGKYDSENVDKILYGGEN